jgi:hypothetical protein
MALVANAYSTYTSIGIREDLSDVIYDISPVETPFQSNIARVGATQKFHEWQTDTLAGATINRQIEGDTITGVAVTPTTRLGNYCQISWKPVAITGTTQTSDAAGRASEMSYQIAKAGRELKRDMEQALTNNQASSAGAIGAARSLAGAESWLSTNNTVETTNTTGTTPGFSGSTAVSPTDGTQAALTEKLLKGVIADTWTAGGDPNVVMVGTTNKQTISGFSGIATLYNLTGDSQGSIIGGADLYVSDFGKHTIVPNRFSRDRTCLVLDMSMWAVAFLRPIHTIDLGKTGDAETKSLITEYTLVSRNEAASGKVADCTA